MPVPKIKQDFGCSFQADELNGVKITWVTPPEVRTDKVLIHLHGGIFVVGINQQHWGFLSRLCFETGRVGVMVDYRLAPEYPYPAGFNDTIAVLTALSERYGANNLVVSGDSAGGCLALTSAMKLRDDQLEFPEKIVLLSPLLDLMLDNPAIKAIESRDPVLAMRGVNEALKLYAGGADFTDPYVSPLRGDLSGLPPILLQVGGREILMPDSRLFRDKAVAQGLALRYQELPEMFHVWVLMYSMLPEGEEAVQEILQFLLD